MSTFVFLFVPTVIFLGLVLPLWLLLHYIAVWRSAKGLSEQDKHLLESTLAQARQLEQRITTLETILDAESPEWRDNYSDQP